VNVKPDILDQIGNCGGYRMLEGTGRRLDRALYAKVFRRRRPSPRKREGATYPEMVGDAAQESCILQILTINYETFN
jgi:hypothetical protein